MNRKIRSEAMSLHYLKQVISPEELKETYALPKEHQELKKKRDKEIQDVIT